MDTAARYIEDPTSAPEEERGVWQTLSALVELPEQRAAFETAIRCALTGLAHSLMVVLDGGSANSEGLGSPRLSHANGEPFPDGLHDWPFDHRRTLRPSTGGDEVPARARSASCPSGVGVRGRHRHSARANLQIAAATIPTPISSTIATSSSGGTCQPNQVTPGSSVRRAVSEISRWSNIRWRIGSTA